MTGDNARPPAFVPVRDLMPDTLACTLVVLQTSSAPAHKRVHGRYHRSQSLDLLQQRRQLVYNLLPARHVNERARRCTCWSQSIFAGNRAVKGVASDREQHNLKQAENFANAVHELSDSEPAVCEVRSSARCTDRTNIGLTLLVTAIAEA